MTELLLVIKNSPWLAPSLLVYTSRGTSNLRNSSTRTGELSHSPLSSSSRRSNRVPPLSSRSLLFIYFNKSISSSLLFLSFISACVIMLRSCRTVRCVRWFIAADEPSLVAGGLRLCPSAPSRGFFFFFLSHRNDASFFFLLLNSKLSYRSLSCLLVSGHFSLPS